MTDDSSFQKELEKYKKLESLSRKILGVTGEAGGEEIKKAYWKLAMRYHPDRFRGSNEGKIEIARRFQNIQAAYEFLTKGKEWKPDFDLNMKRDEKRDPPNADNDWAYFLWWKDKFF